MRVVEAQSARAPPLRRRACRQPHPARWFRRPEPSWFCHRLPVL